VQNLRTILQLLVIAAAVAVAFVPPRAATIERSYANGLYPMLQANLTSVSNRVSFALFDLAIVGFAGTVFALWYFTITRAKKKQRLRAIGRALVATATVLAIVYLWFLAAWGLNYARPPLESRLPYDASRVTPQAVRALAERAVAEANRTHAAAHAAGFPSIYDAPRPLITALQDVERELGRPRTTVVARPKWSILSPFFRASGVSGMLGPFFLETIVNPDLTGPERPVLLAHEWAHLSGYAPESDASFVGLLASLRAGPAAEYSAWLDLVSESVNQLQPVTQQIVLKELGPGPRKDQEAIRERLKALVRPVERVAWSTYDQMLKSQGVEEGVQSYSRVVQLVLGTDILNSSPKPQAPSPKP
jgi:hypothetical protein